MCIRDSFLSLPFRLSNNGINGASNAQPSRGVNIVRAHSKLALNTDRLPEIESLRPREPMSPPVSYTHLRAHETVLDLVCRLLLEKKKNTHTTYTQNQIRQMR